MTEERSGDNNCAATSKTGTSKERRARSNSSSSGSVSDLELSGKADIPNELKDEKILHRNRYTYVLILKSLNNTFETKFLVVPFKPNGLKLGRPVMGNGTSSANGLASKLDPQVKPDNGNFDSRVLSRNHASLSCDAKSGKIYIRDLKSSNGTFLNGVRIGQTEVELKVGDVIDLGTDIDTKFEHRKISALVEDISVIPLIGDDENTLNCAKSDSQHRSSNGGSNGSAMVTATNAQRAAFEAAMFGDVNNLDLEEAVLGSETELLSGIFMNNSIGTSPNLINVIKNLVTDLTLEKQEYERLKSIENFLINYTTKLEYLSKLRIEQSDLKLVQLQNNFKQKLAAQQEDAARKNDEKMASLMQDAQAMKSELDQKAQLENVELEDLKRQVETLNTLLEVEKYKNSQLMHPKLKMSPGIVETNIETENVSANKKTNATVSIILLSSISVGAIAAVFKYAYK